MRKTVTIITFIVLSLFSTIALSQRKVYFVDGYHGGIYGHYPMWVTQFMVDKLAQHPEWKIGIEIEPETWDTVKVKEPLAYSNFEKIVADKRIEFTNPTWAQPYCYNISGESIIRQFEYGIKRIHTHFPDVTFFTYAVEEPCFTSSLPQILKQFGFKYAVLKCPNTCWGGYTKAYGGELVNWIGSDGTSILTVPRYQCEALEDNSTWQTKAWGNAEDYLDACFNYGIANPVGMCYQDAGWKNGPWLGSGSNIRNNSIYVTWKEYIEDISVGKTTDDYHFSQEDILVNLMWGSQVLQKIAQEVRVSENKIMTAEKMAAMANIETGYVPSQSRIDDAWRTLMMAQHHDSWIVPYNGLNKNRTWAQEISLWTGHTNTISDNILSDVCTSYASDKLPQSDNVGFVRVYNTLAGERCELVRVSLDKALIANDVIVRNSKGKIVPSYLKQYNDSSYLYFQAQTPSLGYATFDIQKGKRDKSTYTPTHFSANGDCIIENDMYRILIDKANGGTIKSLIAKKENNREFVDSENQFRLGEVRGYFYDENKFYSTADSPARISVLEDSPLRIIIKIESEIASHPSTQRLTLTTGQRRIDFDLTVDWKHNVGIGEYKQGSNWRDNRRAYTDDRYKLNVMFPVRLSHAQLYKNAPFDVCESQLEYTHFGTWDSIKHNVILNWIDLKAKNEEYGFALLSDHTTSYSYGKDFPLSLTAQYSGIGLWGPDYNITGALNMKYAIVPHSGSWDQAAISVESSAWNEPLIASFHKSIPLDEKSFLNLGNSGYEVSAFKVEGDNILLRLFNADGNSTKRNIAFGFPISSIEEVDLNGNFIEKIKVKKNNITVSMPRFGIKTFLVKRTN